MSVLRCVTARQSTRKCFAYGTRLGTRVLLGVLLGLLVGAASRPALGQETDGERVEQVRSWFEQRYGPDGDRGSATKAELGTLAGLWIDATDPAAGSAARQEALRALIDEVIRIQRAPEGRYPESIRAAMAARVDEILGLDVPPDPLPVETRPPRTLGDVEVRGNGPIPLVLLSDIDYDAAIWDEFAALHEDRYTMYVVTLPGAGGTPPPPFPVGRPPSETPWWDTAAQAVVSLVKEKDLDRPVVVGPLSSAYLAARLAAEHPERFRAAVLLHGLVRGYLGSSSPPSPITLEERHTWVDATLPDLFPSAAPDSVLRSYLGSAGASALDPARAETLAQRAARTHPTVVDRYTTELLTTDLQEELAGLRVPTLVIPSLHDDGSPVSGTEVGMAQWQRLALDRPELPLTIIPFRATRNYAPVDSPVELGRAIEDYLAGRPVRGKPRDPSLTAFRKSSRSEALQVLGATEVEVEYSSPAARGREVWGGVVSWDRVWRAGANAATRLRVSRDVEVKGKPLEAGEYALFVTPREDEPWTVTLSKVSVQFGSFTHDSAYDALRVEVEPEEVEHEDRLRMRIVPRGLMRGRLEISWAGRSVGLDLRAPEGLDMTRAETRPFDQFRGTSWTELAVDTTGDGRSPRAPDGTSLSYHYDAASDTLWFRFELDERPTAPGLGLNVAVDADLDQTTGAAWWGGNTGFRYDRVLTAYVMRGMENTYWGTVGVSDHASARSEEYGALAEDVVLSVDEENGRTLVVGVPASVLAPDGHMDLIGTVGTDAFWNDELVDAGSVELDLRRR